MTPAKPLPLNVDLVITDKKSITFAPFSNLKVNFPTYSPSLVQIILLS